MALKRPKEPSTLDELLQEFRMVLPRHVEKLRELLNREIQSGIALGVTAAVKSREEEIERLKREKLEQQKAFEQRIVDSLVDDLSGAFTQKYFYEVAIPTLMGKLCRAERRHKDRRALYPVMIVTDGRKFKYWNDSRGYPTGNKIIAAFGKAIRRSIRSGDMLDTEDLLIRYGGDEYIVILPHSDSFVTAALAATRAKDEVDQTDWSFLGTDVGPNLPTVDAGAICLRAKSLYGLAASHQPPEGSTVWKIMHGQIEDRDGWKDLGKVDLPTAIGLAWFMKASDKMHEAKEDESSTTHLGYVEYTAGELVEIPFEKIEYLQRRRRAV